ncbi:MAG: acyl-CoA reductase [Ferruginibacter sp.]
MNLQERIELMVWLGNYIKENDSEWQEVKTRAAAENGWFINTFIDIACKQITEKFLQKNILETWVAHYKLDDNFIPKTVGIVMAGNIPLVGFHDFLCVFISGHAQRIKFSSKDKVLLNHLVNKLHEKSVGTKELISISDLLKNCDAYIATGSNNSSRYFDQYFAKYPHIIRRNKTSAAVLKGNETNDELNKLSDDIHLYFGLGCRNVTKLYVPEGYDFIPLLRSFDKYLFFADHHKYKNNYDYQLSILLLNNKYYMTNGSTLVTESEGMFSPIAHLHFEYYKDFDTLEKSLEKHPELQCSVIKEKGFGIAQEPGIFDYADGVDTMEFLLAL